MTPEELHLRMIRFESRTGGSNDYPKDSDQSFIEPDYTALGDGEGYVLYERTAEGLVVTFHDPEEPTPPKPVRGARHIIRTELFWKGHIDDVSLPPGGIV